jgi:hypothetical protein
MHSRPYQEAFDIFKRLRNTKNPFNVFHSVQEAEILMPRTKTPNVEAERTNGAAVAQKRNLSIP